MLNVVGEECRVGRLRKPAAFVHWISNPGDSLHTRLTPRQIQLELSEISQEDTNVFWIVKTKNPKSPKTRPQMTLLRKCHIIPVSTVGTGSMLVGHVDSSQLEVLLKKRNHK
jgi:hypothetical protein